MQKLTYLLVLSSFCSAAALAAYTGPGAENRVSTASQVEQANDDTQVELTGYLVKSLATKLTCSVMIPERLKSKSTMTFGGISMPM